MVTKKELNNATVGFLTNRYEAHSEDLEWKLEEIEAKSAECKRLTDCYKLSRELFALLKSESPSRQLTEGFERVRKALYSKQAEIMSQI